MAGIDGLGFNPSNYGQKAESQPNHNQPVTVQSHGQTVSTQPSIQSLVADAQEESGMLLQDRKSDKLSKRDARSKSASRVREIMKKYLKQVGNVGQSERFEKLAKSLRELGNATPDQIREKLDEFKGQSEDENLEGALLLALEELFSTEGSNEDLLAAVREVKAELGAELQEFYQNQVKSYEDVSEVYSQLLGEYGEEDFLKATDTLISRLGDDLQSQGTTVDSVMVKSTVDSLYHLEVARNTYAAFTGLMNKMQSVFGLSLD